jgi:hypothetical protein
VWIRTVRPDNAEYSREDRALRFGFTGSHIICRSFDVVAHEAGHAVADALKPELSGPVNDHPNKYQDPS